jgi:NAD-dependent SIR2 family protein deacetylase
MMNTRLKQKKLDNQYKPLIDDIITKLQEADRIVVGAGAGLSASAGLDYNDRLFFERLYQPFLKKGYRTVAEAISHHWYLTKENATTYWGFWANHINNIYYHQEQMDTYRLLYDIISDKDYFVITTNGDGQFFKGGFDSDKIFAMQGNYGKFQCQHGCHNVIYDNQKMIQTMLLGFDEERLEIQEKDVPMCPKCGGLLCPNLRVDQYFIEASHMHNKDNYVDFVNVLDEKILFLELGVGFNTPVIIRYPFEEMTNTYDHATLVRVNKVSSQIPNEIKDKALPVDMDIDELLKEIIKKSKG